MWISAVHFSPAFWQVSSNRLRTYFIYASQINETFFGLSGLCDVAWVRAKHFKSEGAWKYCPVLKYLPLAFMNESETKYVAAIWQLGWTANETLHSYRGLRCRCEKGIIVLSSHLSGENFQQRPTHLSGVLVQPLLWSELFAKKNLSLVIWEGRLICWSTWWIPPTPSPQHSDTQTQLLRTILFLSEGGNTDSSAILNNRNLVCSRKA